MYLNVTYTIQYKAPVSLAPHIRRVCVPLVFVTIQYLRTTNPLYYFSDGDAWARCFFDDEAGFAAVAGAW